MSLVDRLRKRPYGFAAALALVLLAGTIVAEPTFAEPRNWDEETAALAPFALVALASTPSILSGGGGLDLSIGPLTSFLNIVLVTGLLGTWAGSPLLAVPILILIGAAVGATNGVLVTKGRYLPVIATLCAFFILGGASLALSDKPVKAPSGWTQHLTGWAGPVPVALLLILVPAAIWAVLRRTAFLDNLYAVGGDDAAAFCAGVDVVRTRIAAYALGGAIAAIAAISVTALLQSTSVQIGTQYTLVALAAVAIGGTPIGGGRGGLLGSLLGASSIYLLQTFLSAMSVSVDWLPVAYGGMLTAGVLIGAQVAKPVVIGAGR